MTLCLCVWWGQETLLSVPIIHEPKVIKVHKEIIIKGKTYHSIMPNDFHTYSDNKEWVYNFEPGYTAEIHICNPVTYIPT